MSSEIGVTGGGGGAVGFGGGGGAVTTGGGSSPQATSALDAASAESVRMKRLRRVMWKYLAGLIDSAHQALQHGARCEFMEGSLGACPVGGHRREHVRTGLRPSYWGNELFHQQLAEKFRIRGLMGLSGDV
jgi:hypothetical protein